MVNYAAKIETISQSHKQHPTFFRTTTIEPT